MTSHATEHQRYALSRGEEDKVLAQCKVDALRNCQEPTALFSACAEGRTISVAWACRTQFRAMQACMKTQMTEEKQDAAKLKYLAEKRGGLPS